MLNIKFTNERKNEIKEKCSAASDVVELVGGCRDEGVVDVGGTIAREGTRWD